MTAVAEGPPRWSASIAFRLPAAIAFIALLVAVFAVAAILALDRARGEMEAYGARTFDSLAAAARVSRETGELLASAPFLINTTSALRISAESRVIVTRIDALAQAIVDAPGGETGALLKALERLKASTLRVAGEAEAASIERDRLSDEVLALGEFNRVNGNGVLLASGINQIALNAAAAENLIQLGELRRTYLSQFGARPPADAAMATAKPIYERLFAGRQAYLTHVHAMRHALSELERDVLGLTVAIDMRTQALSAALADGVAQSSGQIRRLQTLMGLALATVLALSGLTVFYVINRVSRPLGAVANAMAHLPDGETELPAIRHADALELRQLIDAFTTFKASITERNREQARAQRLDALMAMSNQLNHEIGNMIGVISGTAALIERDGLEPRQARRMARIAKAAERGRMLVSGMLSFASHQVLKPERVDAMRIISGMSDILELAAGASVRIRIEGDPVTIDVDPAMLEQSVLNLVLNARDAMPEGGEVQITVRQEGDHAVITVADTGTGMSQEVRDRAFEPYFTTRAGKGGTGLGLPVVYGFARQSGGTVQIADTKPNGTTIILRFPMTSDG